MHDTVSRTVRHAVTPAETLQRTAVSAKMSRPSVLKLSNAPRMSAADAVRTAALASSLNSMDAYTTNCMHRRHRRARAHTQAPPPPRGATRAL